MKKRTSSDSYESTSQKNRQQAGPKGIARFLSRAPLLFVMLALFGLGLALLAASNSKVNAALQPQIIGGDGKIGDAAARQIAALLAEKESRTPAQRKMDSQLIYAGKLHRKEAIANGVEALQLNVEVDKKGNIIVDIISDNIKATQTKFEGMNVEVISAIYTSIRAKLNINDLEKIASFPEVRFITPRQDAKAYRTPKSSGSAFQPLPGNSLLAGTSAGFAERAARVRVQLLKILPTLAAQKGGAITPGPTKGGGGGLPPATTNLINTSEGDKTHKADTARNLWL